MLPSTVMATAAGAAEPLGLAGRAAERTTGTQRAGIAAASRPAASAGLWQRARDYVTLTKPRIISLLLVTTLVPMAVAAGGWPGATLAFWTMLGGYLMAGGANATNMFIDRDIDARMTRTSLRPIPSGRMSPAHVLGFALVLTVGAFAIFWSLVNPASAILALAGYGYYVGIYSGWLKRRTPHNIAIGGGAGAFPPLVGWAAVTGSLSVASLLFFLIVVLWTPPHFWALALVKRHEYGAVGVPMAPNVWGEERTLRQMRAYAIGLVVVSLAPGALGGLGALYTILAAALGVWFLLALARLMSATDRTREAWSLYRTSLLYLALLFAAMAVDVALT
jgi:heme o synthase